MRNPDELLRDVQTEMRNSERLPEWYACPCGCRVSAEEILYAKYETGCPACGGYRIASFVDLDELAEVGS